ncbi:hypothetical protein DE146DRAFT_627007 [Phaeosphaeria sp. MPI-PUGE-AT-0046c]|nr:hypothetical protein DE146DRAFT_627007 [Phaeosphaeria sp. MPI-PUGE-AT-0046c]
MPHQTDDARLPATLPPNPFAPRTPASPRPRETTPIDLTSPTTSPRDSQKRPRAPDNRPSGPRTSWRAGADEKRLTGARTALMWNRVPADRVFAPDPGSYFRPSRKAMSKPGSGTAYQPVNTIDSAQLPSSASKRFTYGKKSRSCASRGETISHGQAAFEDLYHKSLSTPARNASSRQNHAIQAVRVSPTKRRKTEAGTPPPVIDLDDEDDIQELHYVEPIAPARARHLPPPALSAQPRQSAGSRPTSRGLTASSEPTNEFLGMQDVLKATRKAARSGKIHSSTRDNSSKRSISGSVTPRSQSTVLLQEDDDMAAARASRKSILKSLRQGVSDAMDDAGKYRETMSPYFANARINESTTDLKRQTTTEPPTNGANESLRSFKRASATSSHDLISDDELGQDFPTSMRPRSPSKSARTANSGSRRKSKAREAAEGWPLIWARTPKFDSHKTFTSTTHEHPLILRHGKDLNTLEIAVWKGKEDDHTVLATITPRTVIKAWVDNVHRIRLEGSRTADGAQPIFDLEFESMEHLKEFCNDHLPTYCASQRVFAKEEEHMELLFKKPLAKNDKAKMPVIGQSAPSAEGTSRSTRAQAAEAPLWTKMRSETQGAPSATASRGQGETSDAAAHARTSTRPTRTTRATAPTYDSPTSGHDKEVERFSEIHGLGPQWVRDLSYHEGRHRSTVFFDDLPRLDEEEFLNDSLIDFYMIYLFKQSKLPAGKVHFFNTFFYTSLTQNTGRDTINYDAVKRWTSRDDIFDFDYIVVPINQDVHWYLAIICNVKNIARKAIEENFDDATPEKMPDEDGVLGTVVNAISVPPPVEAPDKPATIDQSSAVFADDEVNLFDEESRLNLINPEATESANAQPGTPNAKSPRLSPSQQGATRATPSIFDQPAPLKTVLSNLHASPERKKKMKRRSVAPKRDISQPVVVILDSLSQTRSPAVRALKDWITAEGEAKRGMEAIIKEKGLYPKADQIPTQHNFSDCGVYLLGYVEKFFQDPDEFKRKLLTGEMTPAEDWPQLKPKEMRNNLRDIIFAMAEEQQLTVPMKKKKKVKKGTVADKSSPVKTDTGESKSGPTSPLPKQPTTKMEKLGAVPLQTTLAVTDNESSKAESGLLNDAPRLGSPFKYKKAENFPPPGRPPTRTVQSASPTRTASTTPHQDHIHGRRTHPEVHIQKPASPVKEGGDDVQPLIQAGATSKTLQQAELKARSLSPLKRVKHRTGDVGHGVSLEKSRPGFQPMERKDNTGNKSTEKHNPHGRSDCPIEISDSQEPSQAHAVIHEPSFEEISGFPSQVSQSVAAQAEQGFIGSQLVAQLDADDAQRAGSEEKKIRKPTPPLLQRSQLDPDIIEMEVDSGGNDPMDIADDDDVISETPEAAHRSPSGFPL